jgi:hypothetical protein
MMFVFPSLRYFGRRTIHLYGATFMTAAMLIVAVVGTAVPNNPVAAKILVAFICIWNFFYAWSWGSVGWIIAVEILSTVLRARTSDLATIMGWLSTLVINAVMLYLINPDDANLGMKVWKLPYRHDIKLTILFRLALFSGVFHSAHVSGPMSLFRR